MRFSYKMNHILMIEGGALTTILSNHKNIFFGIIYFYKEIALRAPAVVCCRCLPTQKAKIVEGIRELSKARVCAIGDGGNDVIFIWRKYLS